MFGMTVDFQYIGINYMVIKISFKQKMNQDSVN